MANLPNGVDPSAPGQVVTHCSDADGVPDVGISVGFGGGKVLWLGTLPEADGGTFGVAFHSGVDGEERAAAPFDQWDALVEVFASHIAPAIAAAANDRETLEKSTQAVRAVAAAMIHPDHGWNITALNQARVLIRDALSVSAACHSDGTDDRMPPERFECMIYDAHLPSMTARFRIPEGLPFASGMYEIRRVRRPTAEDVARWAHLPEPPDDNEEGDAA